MLVEPIPGSSIGDSNGIELTMNGIHEDGFICVEMLVVHPFGTPFTLSRRQTSRANLDKDTSLRAD